MYSSFHVLYYYYCFCYLILLLCLCILIVVHIPSWVFSIIVSSSVLFVSKCAPYYCRQASTQLQLTKYNLSYQNAHKSTLLQIAPKTISEIYSRFYKSYQNIQIPTTPCTISGYNVTCISFI